MTATRGGITVTREGITTTSNISDYGSQVSFSTLDATCNRREQLLELLGAWIRKDLQELCLQGVLQVNALDKVSTK